MSERTEIGREGSAREEIGKIPSFESHFSAEEDGYGDKTVRRNQSGAELGAV